MSSTIIQTQVSYNHFFKEWRQEKQEYEDSLIKSLGKELEQGNVDKFRSILEAGIAQLEEIYLKIPSNGAVTESENVYRSKKLRTFLGEMCKMDGRGEFILSFLHFIPIANEPIQQLHGQCLLHLAIGSKALDNVESLLLNVVDIDVNVLWKKQTPLMMLFKVTSSMNFTIVERLVELLAAKRADINLGDYTAHPLSVLCRLTTIDIAQKRRLCTLCSQRFECDLDSLYNGQARRDVEELFPDLEFKQRQAEVTVMTLRSYLLESNEEEFLDKFDQFFDKQNRMMDTIELLQLAASKRYRRSVDKICIKIYNIDLLPYKKPLSKILKLVCSKGYPEVLELLLIYIRQPEIFNELPLALFVVRSMQNQRTADLEECFEMLLSDEKVSIAKCDNRGETALSFAREYDMEQEVMSIIENELTSQFEQI